MVSPATRPDASEDVGYRYPQACDFHRRAPVYDLSLNGTDNVWLDGKKICPVQDNTDDGYNSVEHPFDLALWTWYG